MLTLCCILSARCLFLVVGIELRVLQMQGSSPPPKLPLKPLLLFIKSELRFSNRKRKSKTKYPESHQVHWPPSLTNAEHLVKIIILIFIKNTLLSDLFVLLKTSLIMSPLSLPLKRKLSFHTCFHYLKYLPT